MSETNIERILERVKALFNLAKDSAASKTEKENAIKGAQKLISKYQLESLLNRDLTVENNYNEFIIFDEKIKNRINWKEQLILEICHINGCTMILRKSSAPSISKKRLRTSYVYYTCFGKKENTQICKVLIDLILPQVELLAKEDKQYYEKINGIKKRGPSNESFKLGCVKRVIDRLNEAKDDEINNYARKGSKNNKSEDSDIFANALILAISDYRNELNRSRELLKEKFNDVNAGLKTTTINNKSEKIGSSAYYRGIESGEKVNVNILKMLTSEKQ